MHFGPFDDEYDDFNKEVKKEILKIDPKENSNIIISAHNGVIRSTDIFDKIESNTSFKDIKYNFMEEGGFIVMRNDNGKLVFVEKFYSFHEFYKKLFKRPKN